MLPIDVSDCVLEMRLAPVISNLGVIVLTTAGYVLVVPFPRALPLRRRRWAAASAHQPAARAARPINTAFVYPRVGRNIESPTGQYHWRHEPRRIGTNRFYR